MKKLSVLALVGVVLLASVPLRAQNFIVTEEDEINQVLNLFSAFAAGGVFHTADIHGLGGFDVGLRGVAVFTPEEYQEFQDGPFEDVNFIGLPFVHGSVGLPFKLEATGRFFHFPIGDEPTDGFITLVGVGLKYGILQAPVLPKVAVMATYHAFFVPEEFSFGTVSTISLKAVASKNFAIFTVYGGVGIDRTTLELNYEIAPGVPLTGDFSSDNIHGNIGLAVRPLPLVYVNADYMFTEEFNGFNVGVGLSFR